MPAKRNGRWGKVWLQHALVVAAVLLAGCSSAPASYYYTQKQVQAGQLDFHHTLRINEYLNAFPQDWLKVPAGEEAVLHVDPLTRTPPPVGENMLFQVAVKTRAPTPAEMQQPLAVSFVMDVSGSMAGEKINDLKAALKNALLELKDGDVVSLVTFNSQATVIASAVKVTRATRQQLVADIDAMQAGGATNIEAGLVKGYRELAQFPDIPGRRMILLTDGISQVDVREPADIAFVAGVDEVAGARISTIGLGLDVDEKLLRALAKNGNGQYFFADNSTTLTGILREGIATTVFPVATGLKLDIQLGKGLRLVNLYGAEKPEQGADIQADLGTLNLNDWRILVIEAQRVAAADNAVSASGQYTSFKTGKTVSLQASGSGDQDQLNRQVLRNAVIYGNAQALISTGYLVQQRKYDKALAILNLQINNNRIVQTWDDSDKFANELSTLTSVRDQVIARRDGTEVAASAPADKQSKAPPTARGNDASSLRSRVLAGLKLASGTPPGTWLSIARLTQVLLK